MAEAMSRPMLPPGVDPREDDPRGGSEVERVDDPRGGDPHELVALGSIAQLGASDGRERTVLASVRARDEATGAVFGLRYRLRFVRGDRWYVAAVNQTTPKEG